MGTSADLSTEGLFLEAQVLYLASTLSDPDA
jgi:hypothetical protein